MTAPTSLPTVAVGANVQRAIAPDSYVVIARAVVRAVDSARAAADLAVRYAEVEAVVAGLTHLGLDVARGAVSVHLDWESDRFGNSAPSGWQASRHLQATGRDPGQVAELVGALGRVTDVVIEGPHWQIDRDNPAHAELAAEAVHEAIARAGRYAAALGGTLGRLVELSDTGMGGGGMREMYLASAGMADNQGGLETMDFTPQPIDVSASVQGRWYLTLPE